MSEKLNFVMTSKKLNIEFENITYTVKERKGRKEIIKGVSGKFYSGQLTAIMGPSGAGKTSLLNLLTGFQMEGTTGTVKCNGVVRHKGKSDFKKESCYILQEDIVPALFTVQESMMMAANLKIANLSTKSKEYLINEILDMLGLKSCRNTKCQSLSGGQKKRLSVALELVDNPSVIFLDEPTTGLDSSSSLHCVRMLKELARGGRNVICTIHQPSAIIYDMFDHVFIMANGKCVYQGASINTISYLSSLGFHCPQYHNPADYILEVVNGDYGDYVDYLASAASSEDWRSVLPTIKINSEFIDDIKKNGVYDSEGKSCSYEIPSEWKKFVELMKRSSVLIYRDWTFVQLKIILNILVGLFLGVTYQNIGNDASKGISNLTFYLCSVIYVSYTSMMPMVLKFPTELAAIKKERFNNWYKLKTYYTAVLVLDVPLQIIFSFVYSIMAFLISAQPMELDRFAKALSIQSLVALVASSFGLIMGTLFKPINGLFFGAVALAALICFAGVLIIFTHMNTLMYLVSYLAFTSFAVEGLTEAWFGCNRPNLECPAEVDYCDFKSPSKLLEILGMNKQNFWVDVIYLIVTCIVFRAIAFCTLKRKVNSVL